MAGVRKTRTTGRQHHSVNFAVSACARHQGYQYYGYPSLHCPLLDAATATAAAHNFTGRANVKASAVRRTTSNRFPAPPFFHLNVILPDCLKNACPSLALRTAPRYRHCESSAIRQRSSGGRKRSRTPVNVSNKNSIPPPRLGPSFAVRPVAASSIIPPSHAMKTDHAHLAFGQPDKQRRHRIP